MLKTFALLAALAAVTGCARTGAPQPANIQTSQGQQPDQAQQQLHEEIEAGQNQCFAKYNSGEYRTMVAVQKCYNTVNLKAYRAVQFPYMDLVDLLFAKNLTIAKRLDQKKITLEEANVEYHEAESQLITESQKRSAMATSAQTAPQPVSDSNPCRSMALRILDAPGLPEAKLQALQMSMQMFYPQGCP